MFAKNRCRVASFSLRCLRLSKRFCKKNHRTDAPWGWSLFANGRLERRWRTSKLCWNVNSSNLCVWFFKFWIMCAFTWYNCTWHLFHQSKLKAVAHLSSLSTWYSQADPGLGPHTTGAIIPRRQAEALHRRALAGRKAHLGANHPDTLTSMSNLALLLRAAGKAGWGWAEVFRWREVTFLEGVSPRAFFCLAKAWGPDSFFSISRYYWVTFFEWTNTN